jgi:hypothetical protein
MKPVWGRRGMVISSSPGAAKCSPEQMYNSVERVYPRRVLEIQAGRPKEKAEIMDATQVLAHMA